MVSFQVSFLTSLKLYCLCTLIYLDLVSYRPSWLLTYYIAEADLELVIFLPPPTEYFGLQPCTTILSVYSSNGTNLGLPSF